MTDFVERPRLVPWSYILIFPPQAQYKIPRDRTFGRSLDRRAGVGRVVAAIQLVNFLRFLISSKSVLLRIAMLRVRDTPITLSLYCAQSITPPPYATQEWIRCTPPLDLARAIKYLPTSKSFLLFSQHRNLLSFTSLRLLTCILGLDSLLSRLWSNILPDDRVGWCCCASVDISRFSSTLPLPLSSTKHQREQRFCYPPHLSNLFKRHF